MLIARFLSPAEQGYYYTYASLIALQTVFELGFSQVVMQLASHERAHVSIDPGGSVTGDETARARLASVLQLSVRWYGAGSLLLALALIPAGFYFFFHPPALRRRRCMASSVDSGSDSRGLRFSARSFVLLL